MPIAADLHLRDYDSPDTQGSSLSVRLTLREAIDRESEGVAVEVTGGVVMTELVSSEDYTREYVLSNGSSYSQYEEVCLYIYQL